MAKTDLISDDPNEEALVLSSLISFLVHEAPTLESLTRDELKAVARHMVFDDLKENLKQRVEMARIDYTAKREVFLARHNKKSHKTAQAYAQALDLLEQWALRAGKQVLELKASEADSFIDSLDGSSATIRLRVAAVSSFFTFMERETNGRVRNPFRGTKGRPKKSTKSPEVPNMDEIELIKASVVPTIQAAITVMVDTGIRVGALSTLTVRAGKYYAYSKGKEISGTISEEARKAIQDAGLEIKMSFAGLKEDAVRNAFKYATNKLHKEGRLKAKYSVHDLRHYFAIREYLKEKDIYKLKLLLGHASIQVTETYLKGLEKHLG
jgi:integrase